MNLDLNPAEAHVVLTALGLLQQHSRAGVNELDRLGDILGRKYPNLRTHHLAQHELAQRIERRLAGVLRNDRGQIGSGEGRS